MLNTNLNALRDPEGDFRRACLSPLSNAQEWVSLLTAPIVFLTDTMASLDWAYGPIHSA